MTYDYKCERCEKIWEEKQNIENRNIPCKNPCPYCKSENSVIKLVSRTGISYDGAAPANIKGGSEWNNLLKTIHKNSGRNSKIETY